MSLADIKGLLRLEQRAFTRVAKRPNGVRDAHIILFTVALVASSLAYLFEMFLILPVLERFMASLGESFDVPALSTIDFVAGVIASVVLAILFTWLWALLTKWFATLLGAKKGSVKEYFVVFGHAYSIRIIKFIPIIGFFAWIYNMVVNVKGVSVLSGLSTGRAAAAYFLPLIIFMVLVSLLLGILIAMFVVLGMSGSFAA